MIISVGYRVKSREGITFRKWANKVLKDYLLKGYVVNEKRLNALEKTVKLIEIANRAEERLENNEAKDILKVIGNYSKSLDLLDDYDHRVVKKIKGNIDNRVIIIYRQNLLPLHSLSRIFTKTKCEDVSE